MPTVQYWWALPTLRLVTAHWLLVTVIKARKNKQKKREPLGQLSRSSGCIYLSQYIIFALRGKTPHVSFYEDTMKVE
ncbi:hypothetical protein NUACC26_029900 [Scytonema sp. NUACC26]